MTQVHRGDVVRIHYTGKLPGGAVFGSTEGAEPVEFVADGGHMIEGLAEAVLGMEVGGKKSVTVTPDQGFGPRQPDLERRVPRSALPEGVHVGDQLVAQRAGQQTPVWVRELGEEFAVVDGNHPLAGQTLVFDIELVSVRPPG